MLSETDPRKESATWAGNQSFLYCLYCPAGVSYRVTLTWQSWSVTGHTGTYTRPTHGCTCWLGGIGFDFGASTQSGGGINIFITTGLPPRDIIEEQPLQKGQLI